MIPFNRGKFVGPLACKVTAITAITGRDNIWRYTVQALDWDLDDYVASASTYEDQEFYAINVNEIGNTNTEAMGVTISSLPTGFSFDSVPVGRVVLVWLSPGADTDTNDIAPLAVFQWPNQFSGTCE